MHAWDSFARRRRYIYPWTSWRLSVAPKGANTVTMSHLPVRVKRLFEGYALPGWLLLGWKLLNFVSNVVFATSRAGSVWRFLTSPLGNLLTILVGLAWLFAVALLPRREGKPTHPAAAVPVPAKTDSEADLCEALRQIADDDSAKIRERVRQVSQRIEFHFAPGSDPYIDIVTDLWNGSVFDLVSCGEILGHGIYAGNQLAAEPRVIVPVEPMLLRLKHGDTLTFTVRQFLSTEVADMMWANRNRGVAVDFQPVAVSFEIVPLPGLLKQVYRWWGSRFTLDDAKRV